MKITRVETFLVPPRWLFCRIETDDGLIGWGEPVVEGRAEVVRAAVDVLAEYLIGQDPLRIQDHWQVLTKAGFYRDGPVLSSAVAGIDQALWGGDEPAELVESIAAQVEAGFTAVKMNASGRISPIATAAEVDDVVARAATAREALGPHRDFAMDCHGRFTPATARRVIPELAPHRPLFVEEPVLPEHQQALAALVAASPVPLATGERIYGRAGFLPVLQAGMAVVQPDLSHAGGISEVTRIASLAETFGALLAPHCPLGPIALAASLQVGFATPNLLIQEQSLGIHYNKEADLLSYVLDPEPFRFVDGHAVRGQAPGLGVTVDEAAVRAADQLAHRWRNPVWRHADGSLAEW